MAVCRYRNLCNSKIARIMLLRVNSASVFTVAFGNNNPSMTPSTPFSADTARYTFDKAINQMDMFIESHQANLDTKSLLWLKKIEHDTDMAFTRSLYAAELDRNKALSAMELDHVRERDTLKFRHVCELAFIKNFFAEVSQRFLLQLFLNRVINALEHRDAANGKNDLREYFPNCCNRQGKMINYPKKSAVETILRKYPPIWEFIKAQFGITCDLPSKLDYSLLYGELSESVHIPRIFRLLIPSNMEDDAKNFLLELARIFEHNVKIVDVEAAAAHHTAAI